MQYHGQGPVLSFGKRNAFDFPGTIQRNRVEELERGVDLPIGRVGQVFDVDLMEEELANLGFAKFFGGAHEEGSEAACVEQVMPLGGRAEFPQAEIGGHAIVETAHEETSW